MAILKLQKNVLQSICVPLMVANEQNDGVASPIHLPGAEDTIFHRP